MPVKNAVAKVWNITPSYDGKRWSTYPAGDKPAGGGLAPTWNDPSAIGPGWVYQATYGVGILMTADFGAAANSPSASGYSYELLRGGSVIQTGTNVSGLVYTPVSADSKAQLTFNLRASNANGNSEWVTAASVTIE